MLIATIMKPNVLVHFLVYPITYIWEGETFLFVCPLCVFYFHISFIPYFTYTDPAKFTVLEYLLLLFVNHNLEATMWNEQLTNESQTHNRAINQMYQKRLHAKQYNAVHM